MSFLIFQWIVFPASNEIYSTNIRYSISLKNLCTYLHICISDRYLSRTIQFRNRKNDHIISFGFLLDGKSYPIFKIISSYSEYDRTIPRRDKSKRSTALYESWNPDVRLWSSWNFLKKKFSTTRKVRSTSSSQQLSDCFIPYTCWRPPRHAWQWRSLWKRWCQSRWWCRVSCPLSPFQCLDRTRKQDIFNLHFQYVIESTLDIVVVSVRRETLQQDGTHHGIHDYVCGLYVVENLLNATYNIRNDASVQDFWTYSSWREHSQRQLLRHSLRFVDAICTANVLTVKPNNALELLLSRTLFVVRDCIPQRTLIRKRFDKKSQHCTGASFVSDLAFSNTFYIVNFDCACYAGAAFVSDTFRGQRQHFPTHCTFNVLCRA